ncbi:MAG: alpha/beta fold hydrolase [Patescibacteria group bacterium]
MQKNIIIKSKDNKFNIYGVLDQRIKTEKLIIFVHGLTGHKNEHQFYNAVSFFNNKKFATFRFDLYSGEKKGRKLENCEISTYSEYLNQVIKHFKNKYKNIFLVGHSLGGSTILEANLKDIAKIVLWDPSVNLTNEDDKEWYYFNKKIGAFIVSWGPSYIVSNKMIKGWENFNYSKWISNATMPLKIICAGRGILKNDWKKLISQFSNKTNLVVIKEAGHCFDEEDTENKLFQETHSWFK